MSPFPSCLASPRTLTGKQSMALGPLFALQLVTQVYRVVPVCGALDLDLVFSCQK